MSKASTETGFADVNGTRLYWESNGSGLPILLLHGFSLDRRMWRRQVEALATRFRVVAYDARGFGRSATPDGKPFRHCDDAAALCEHLGLARVVAVGHSIGAHQMLEFALSRPDLVSAWAGVCTSGLAGIPFPDDIMAAFAAIKTAAREKGIDAAKRIWISTGWFAPAREEPGVAREIDAILADYSGWHWTNENPVKSLEPPAAERLARLRVPALVVTGGRDLAYNDVVARTVLERVPSATALRLPKATHMANMEEFDAVTDAIAALAERAAALPIV